MKQVAVMDRVMEKEKIELVDGAVGDVVFHFKNRTQKFFFF